MRLRGLRPRISATARKFSTRCWPSTESATHDTARGFVMSQVFLPAVVPSSGVIASPIDAYAATLIPSLIADAGDAAGWRYVEFFTANTRNAHTRRAYARACSQFFAWCEDSSLTLTTIR